MNYEEQVTNPHNLRMRKSSGEIDDPRPLVALLYELVRDEVTTGVLEDKIDRLSQSDGPFQFTNGWLAQWAQDAVERLDQTSDEELTIPWPLVRPLGLRLTPGGVQDVWNTFVKPAQEGDVTQSAEMRCLMAILRAVYRGMVDHEAS